LTVDILPMERGPIEKAASIVRRGGLIVFPTDTVYGLGCDPMNEEALARLFETKGRTSKPVSVLCYSAKRAGELVELKGRALELAKACWPGALTIIAPLRRRVPSLLTQGLPNLGVRVPDQQSCLELIGRCSGWLTGTSANVSGRPSARTASDAVSQLGGSVDLVLDGGTLRGRESTVVKVVGEQVTILRTGPVEVRVE